MTLTVEERRAKKAARTRERYANDPEYRARQAAYKRRPEYRAKKAARERERRANDPEYRAKELARERERRANDPEYRARLAARKRKAQREKYGWQSNWREAPSSCESCGTPFCNSLRPCLDHCHTTDWFRGWLCHGCNISAGYLKDDPSRARKLAEYLEAHG